MVNIPALNEIVCQGLDEDPEYPEETKKYMILSPDDYEGHGIDVEGNIALLLNEENAREVKRLAEVIIEDLTEGEEPRGESE